MAPWPFLCPELAPVEPYWLDLRGVPFLFCSGMGCAPAPCSSFSCLFFVFLKVVAVFLCVCLSVALRMWVPWETERTSDTLSWSCALLGAALCGFCEPSSGPCQELLTLSHLSSLLSSLTHPHTNLLEKSLHHNRSCGKLPPSAVCLRMENLIPLCLCWCFLISGAFQDMGAALTLIPRLEEGTYFYIFPFPL